MLEGKNEKSKILTETFYLEIKRRNNEKKGPAVLVHIVLIFSFFVYLLKFSILYRKISHVPHSPHPPHPHPPHPHPPHPHSHHVPHSHPP